MLLRPLLCFVSLFAATLFAADSAVKSKAKDESRPITTSQGPSARSIPDDSAPPKAQPSAEERAASTGRPPVPTLSGAKANVVVIPVREQVDTPLLFIIRRGLKEAIEQKANVVVLDMKTPGGALDVTFDIMEALGKFPGKTITYVNDQAISAGAFISATTEEIWFSPRGKIGAAAPVNAGGQEIDKSMRQKVVSFLRAEVRSISEGKGYRGQVISAMIDEDFELKIGDTVLKPRVSC